MSVAELYTSKVLPEDAFRLMSTDRTASSSLRWTSYEPRKSTGPWEIWDRIVEVAQYPAFMQSRFVTSAVASFGCPNGRLFLGRDGERFVAGAVLMPIGIGRWSTFQPAQLPLGAYVTIRELSLQDAMPSLIRQLPGTVLSVAITQQDPDIVLRPIGDNRLEVVDYATTGRVDVTGTYEQFWAARGKNLRQNLGKQQRRLETIEGPIEFEVLNDSTGVDEAFVQFATLESGGWKASGGTAVDLNTVQGAFYRTVLSEFASSGDGFALRLSVRGRAVAIDLGVADARCAVLLKTTYDENYKAYSPAQLLHQRAFEHFFRSGGISRVEFYGRMLEWHTRWTEQSRTLFHVNYYRKPIVRSARNGLKAIRRLASMS